MVRYGSQRGFGGVTGTKTALVGRQEMVFGQVTVELLVDCSLYDFGDDWDNGDGTVVGRVGWIAGFKDRVHQGVFPGQRNIGLGNARVDQIQDDLPDRIKAHAEQVDADAVITAG